MYSYIKGKLVTATPAFAILEAQGIGYKILIPASCYAKLPQIENEVFLHTAFVIRENSQALYGFLTDKERDIFEILLGVTGIGPKMALSIIGHMSLAELQHAIASQETTPLVKVPGIGKKTAERLLIEMRDKLTHLFPTQMPQITQNGYSELKSQTVLDAVSALMNLGYSQMAAQKAVAKTLAVFSDDADLRTILTESLKQVANIK